MFKWLLGMAFERVYTVWDYYDGPRSGIAEYRGQPHHYNCEWNETKDDYAATFVLTPIDQQTLTLAMEQWAIWRQWQDAFHRGEVPQSTHRSQLAIRGIGGNSDGAHLAPTDPSKASPSGVPCARAGESAARSDTGVRSRVDGDRAGHTGPYVTARMAAEAR